jgi:hypothetical protein
MDLLPGKHITFSESLVGLGALILAEIGSAKTVDEIWLKLHDVTGSGPVLAEKIRFDDLLLALDFLFMIGAVRLGTSGEIHHAHS